jgi:tetratricopeptide (TPR) repeat protein
MSLCAREAIPSLLIRRIRSEHHQEESVAQRDDNYYGQKLKDSESLATGDDPDAFIDNQLEEDIALLTDYAFVSPTSDGTLILMLHLVKIATQRWLHIRKEADHWISIFMRNLDNTFVTDDFEKLEQCRVLYPHARAALDLQTNNQSATLRKASICYKAGWFAREQGFFYESHQFLDLARNVQKTELGWEHPDTLASMASLAATYSKQERWSEAAGLQETVLEIRQRRLGREHSDTLTSMHDLGKTYSAQGRLDEAVRLHITAMKNGKRAHEAAHLETLKVMHRLAATFERSGQWSEAEQLQVTVLETRKAMLGAEHLDTLTSMASLAMTYSKQERWREAEKLQGTVLEIRKRELGLEHPDTITITRDLAEAYRRQGRWSEAQRLLPYVEEDDDAASVASHGSLQSVFSTDSIASSVSSVNEPFISGMETFVEISAQRTDLVSLLRLATATVPRDKFLRNNARLLRILAKRTLVSESS